VAHERDGRATIARAWHGLTAGLALAGLSISLVMAASHGPAATEAFTSPVARTFNIFAYFTIQSNLIVAITCLLLALRPGSGTHHGRLGTVFRVFRLDGLVMIAITGVVYHALLAALLDLGGWQMVSDQIVHTAVPLMAAIGWLVFGPRGLISWKVVGFSVVYPLLWLAFTLARGAIDGWYPYPFIDVGELGYARVTVNVLGITAGFVALAAGALGLDRLLTRSSPVEQRRAAD
jgi:hypothetical protein